MIVQNRHEAEERKEQKDDQHIQGEYILNGVYSVQPAAGKGIDRVAG